MKKNRTNTLLLYAMLGTVNIHAQQDDLLFKSAQSSANNKDYVQAACLFQKAITEKPLHINAYIGLGLALFNMHEYELATQVFKQAAQIAPKQPLVWYNLAFIARILGDNQLAIHAYQKTLELKPKHENAHFGLAKTYLACGNFERGWEEFEWRYDDVSTFRQTKIPLEHFKNKKVLIRSEWGLGDIIQFIRYAYLLHQHGAQVFFECPKLLHPLLSGCSYLEKLYTMHQKIPPMDYHIPLLSLPYLCNTTLATIPTTIPYLTIPQDIVDFWQPHVCKNNTFNIGLCWHAKPIFLEDHVPTRRSIPLHSFEPIASLEGVSCFSLQKQFGTDELENIKNIFSVHDFGPDLDTHHGCFMDTAAIMHHLDLVISADTSIVHLAGALGIKTWVLLPYNAEWRWLEKRTDSPWYPGTMRLFRQQKPGDWDSVIQEVLQALKEEISLHHLNEKALP